MDNSEAVVGERASLPRAVILLLGAAAAVIVIAGMKSSASILGPTFLALTLVIAVHPLRNWLQRRGLAHWAAAGIGLLLIYAILAALVAAVVLSLARLAAILPDYQRKFDEIIGQGRGLLEQYGVGQQQVQKVLNVDANRVFSVVSTALGSTFGILSALLLVATLALFMAVDATSYTRRLALLADSRPHLVDALRAFSRGTREYLLVSTVFGLIVAILDTVALWIMGIPLAALWGLLAFITNYIPNIGFVLGLVPPALLGLLEGGPLTMIVVIIVYSVINFVIQTVIQPKIVGDTAGLSVTLAMASLIFWGWVLGPLGALLAIPLTLLAKALLVDTDPSARWLGLLVSSDAQGEAGKSAAAGRRASAPAGCP